MITSSKTQRVELRISPAAKEMIQAAAQAQDKTVSEFLLDSGLTSAAETLADRRLFLLDDTQWLEFQAALDAPPRPRRRLARLMKTSE
ncbi:MAG TPA: DUF1778 domain-containing protein [Methylococcaceae bacterium]|nr:DUF1778 domain-containing protein [Methylococcaceae bacterium]